MDDYGQMVIRRLCKKRQITPSGCWEFTGYIESTGYAKASYMGENWYVHRLVLFLFRPKEYFAYPVVMHLCDNRKCFNPEHLKGATDRENINYKDNPERKIHCGYGHEFTPENTYEYKSGRICRACALLKAKDQREALKGVR